MQPGVMKSRFAFMTLLGLNLLLGAWLLAADRHAKSDGATPHESQSATKSVSAPAQDDTPNLAHPRPGVRAPVPETPFAQVYSTDLKQFAANLRAHRCPEETTKDILTAEIHRRYKAQEEALRPTPADHVPAGWSPRTSEPKLIERRQQASALARTQAELLGEALGYEVPIPLPLYAMTTADLKLETELLGSSPAASGTLRRINENYWAGVQSLQQRTKGFWLPEDLNELERLKDQRKEALRALGP
jgi:hypothetical protein